MQEGNRAKLELIEPDLRVFWERQDSSIQEKVSRELIAKEQEEKMRKEQVIFYRVFSSNILLERTKRKG